jgi:SSS family solute:Na+ symporter/sodium/proline symporter
VTAWGAVAAIAAGAIVTLGWDTAWVKHHVPEFLANRDAIFPALAAAVVAMVVVSVLTRLPTREQVAQFSD